MSERLRTDLRKLTPDNDAQRTLRARALEIADELAQTRLLAATRAQNSIPALLLIELVMWFAIMFAGAVLMIEELNRPFEGLMKVSSAPMRYALAHLGQ